MGENEQLTRFIYLLPPRPAVAEGLRSATLQHKRDIKQKQLELQLCKYAALACVTVSSCVSFVVHCYVIMNHQLGSFIMLVSVLLCFRSSMQCSECHGDV